MLSIILASTGCPTPMIPRHPVPPESHTRLKPFLAALPHPKESHSLHCGLSQNLSKVHKHQTSSTGLSMLYSSC